MSENRHVTTAHLLAEYDADRRAKAANVGHPVKRAQSGILERETPANTIGLLFTDTHGVAFRNRKGETALLSYDLLANLVESAYGPMAERPSGDARPVLVADRATWRSVVRIADKWASSGQGWERRKIAKIVAYRDALAMSSAFPILTDVLSHRYWLPAGPETTDLHAWSKAFGIGADATQPAAFLRLATKATGDFWSKEVTRALGDEAWGVRSFTFRSDTSQSRAFASANNVAEAHRVLTELDPLLAERHCISGEVSKINIVSIETAKGVKASVSDPFKLRDGSEVEFFSPQVGGTVKMKLSDVEFINDSLVARFSGLTGDKRGYLEDAKAKQAPLYAASSPFFKSGGARGRQRWEPNTSVSLRQVSMPLHVMVAGGPQEA